MHFPVESCQSNEIFLREGMEKVMCNDITHFCLWKAVLHDTPFHALQH